MRRSVILVVALVVVLVTGLWWMFLISPKNEAISAAENRLADAEALELVLQTQLGQLRAIKDAEVSYIVAIGEMEQSIPVRPDLATFIDAVTLLAERSGIDLLAIQPAAPVQDPEEPYYQIDVGLSLQGSFWEVLGFLYGLESLERLVRVDLVSLAATESDTPPVCRKEYECGC